MSMGKKRAHILGLLQMLCSWLLITSSYPPLEIRKNDGIDE